MAPPCNRPVCVHQCSARLDCQRSPCRWLLQPVLPVWVGSAINRLSDELAMVAVVRSLRELWAQCERPATSRV